LAALIKENASMRNFPTIIVSIGLLGLSACSSLEGTKTSAIDSQLFEAKKITALNTWQLKGKLGVRSPQQATSANLQWLQNPHQFELKLSGPFGTGAVIARGNRDSIEVVHNSTSYTGAPDVLGQRILGVALPLDAITWWARGLPSPYAPPAVNSVTGSGGTPKSFQQAGWQLSFSSFQPTAGYLLPRKISGQFGDLSFKLVISNWSIQDN
jgi:outer membrane lipoprotein LolB